MGSSGCNGYRGTCSGGGSGEQWGTLSTAEGCSGCRGRRGGHAAAVQWRRHLELCRGVQWAQRSALGVRGDAAGVGEEMRWQCSKSQKGHPERRSGGGRDTTPSTMKSAAGLRLGRWRGHGAPAGWCSWAPRVGTGGQEEPPRPAWPFPQGAAEKVTGSPAGTHPVLPADALLRGHRGH